MSTIENKAIVIFMSILFSCSYIFISIWHVENVVLIADTLEYKYNFDFIYSDPFPYGIEIIVPSIMYFVKSLGGDFKGFMLLSLLVWLHMVIYAVFSVKKSLFFIIVPFFFMSFVFLNNSTFLIRQYYSAFFFIIWLFRKNKKDILSCILVLLSCMSHISSIVWFIVCTRFFMRILYRKYIVGTFFIFVLTSLLSGFSFFSYFIDKMVFFSSMVNLNEINRKVAFYVGDNTVNVLPVPLLPLLIAIFLFLLSTYTIYKIRTLNTVSTYMSCLCSLIFFQSGIFILLKDNLIMANRVGFFSYYFSIPAVCILLSFYFKKNKECNHVL